MNRNIILLVVTIMTFCSCTSEKKDDTKVSDKTPEVNTEINEERNKTTAIAAINAMIVADMDGVVKDIAADSSVIDYGDGSMPPVRGIDSIKVALKAWRGALSEYKAENLLAMADGDHVAVFGDWSGTFKEDFMGMKVAGKSFRIKDVDVFKFNSDGKIIEHRNIQSSASMLSQMGIAPPSPQ